MKNMKKFLLLAVMLVATFMLTACGKKTTINLNDYVYLETEGYDTIGSAYVAFDFDKFEDDFDGKIKKDGKEVDPERFIEKCVDEMEIDKTYELSNGDVVTVSWDCDEDKALENYNIVLEYDDFELTVEGLTELEEFNPFDYITLDIEGSDGDAYVYYDYDYSMGEFGYLNVYFEGDTYDLSIGDEVTLVVDVYDAYSLAEYYGVKVTETRKTYSIDRLDKYIASLDELPEATLEDLIAETETKVYDYVAEEDTVDSVSYVGYYFLGTDDYYYEENDENEVYLIYKVNGNIDGVDYEYYYCIYYEGIELLVDDTWDYDYWDYAYNYITINDTYFYGYSSLDELVGLITDYADSEFDYTSTDLQ